MCLNNDVMTEQDMKYVFFVLLKKIKIVASQPYAYYVGSVTLIPEAVLPNKLSSSAISVFLTHASSPT